MTMSLTSLFMPVKLEWNQTSFQSFGWKDTVISQVSRAGRGHTQAIKKVTAHPAQWQAEGLTLTHMHSKKYKRMHTTNIHVITCFLWNLSMSSLITIKALDLCHLCSPHILMLLKVEAGSSPPSQEPFFFIFLMFLFHIIPLNYQL